MTGDRRHVIIALAQLDHIKIKIIVSKSVCSCVCVCECGCVRVCGGICQTSQSQLLCKVLYCASVPVVNCFSVLTWFVTNCLKRVFYGCVMTSRTVCCLQVVLNLLLNFSSPQLYLPLSLTFMVGVILPLIHSIRHMNWNDQSIHLCVIYHPAIVAISDLTVTVTLQQTIAKSYLSSSQ